MYIRKSKVKSGNPFKNLSIVYLEDFRKLFVVFNYHDVGFAVMCYILAGFWRIGGVDSCSKSSEEQREIRSCILLPLMPCISIIFF